MAGIVVAAVHARRRRQKQEEEVELEGHLQVPAEELLARLERLDGVLEEEMEGKTFRFGNQEANKERDRAKHVDGLLERVENQIKRSTSYRKLFGTVVFFIVYVIMLILRRDITASFAIEQSLITALKGTLPDTGAGGWFNDGEGATGKLGSQDDFYSWLSGIVGRAYQNPVCGDGRCQAPLEFPGFGRFGCPADCGNYPNTTTLTIDFSNFQTSKPDRWDISAISYMTAKPPPQFKFNIWSDTMQDYLFANDMDNVSSIFTIPAPDGKYRVDVYQTNLVSAFIPDELYYDALNVEPYTVPSRIENVPGFYYGDKKEYLAFAATTYNALRTWCWGNDVDGQKDSVCSSHTFKGQDMMFKVLAGYGIKGTISAKNGTTGRKTLTTLNFCTAFPNGTKGYTTTNLNRLLAAEFPCDATTSRRAMRERDAVPQVTPVRMKEMLRQRRNVSVELAHRQALAANPTLAAKRAAPAKPSARQGSAGKERAGRTMQTRMVNGQRRQFFFLAEPVLQWTDDCCTSSSSYGLYQETRTGTPVKFWGNWSFPSVANAQHIQYVIKEGDDPQPLANPQCGVYTPGSYNWTFGQSPRTIGPFMQDLEDCVKDSVTKCGTTWQIKAIACLYEFGFWTPSNVMHETYFFQTPPIVTASFNLPAYNDNNLDYVAYSQVEWILQAVAETMDVDGLPAGNMAALGWNLYNGRTYLEEYDFPRFRRRSAQADRRAVTDGSIVLTLKTIFESNDDAQTYKDILILRASESAVSARFNELGGSGGATLQSITVVVAAAKTADGMFCQSHWECEDGFACLDVNDFSQGPPTCQPCDRCMYNDDAYNNVCDQDKCPDTGKFPECVNGTKLAESFVCPDNYAFEVWTYTERVADNITGALTYTAPTVTPAFTPEAREITPFNRLLGAIAITQHRKASKTCATESNEYVGNYSKAGQVMCTGEETDKSPYGYDPAFLQASSIYDGKLKPEDFYLASERQTILERTTTGNQTLLSTPFGFFPHTYDQNRTSTSKVKDSTKVYKGVENLFTLYLGERLTVEQVNKIVTYMKDGQFIDGQTDYVEVKIITFNSENRIFALTKFKFTWEAGGGIPWEYSINTVSVTPYDSPAPLVLQIIVIVFLVINVAFIVLEILRKIRRFEVFEYFTDFFNWIDFAQIFFLIATITSWWAHEANTNGFNMKILYPVLTDIGAKARMFETNADEEKQLLELMEKVETMMDSMTLYSTFAGVSVILFIFRLLKSLDFQERMGLVTRTIAAALVDLAHFIVLFAIVYLGYACVGSLLFGHQVGGMATFNDSCLTMIMIIISLDTSQFNEMSHAAPPWAFNLFIWSYLIIAFFILLNIFLAILVDAYVAVKEDTKGSIGLPQDLSRVVTHGARRWLPLGKFVSDQNLIKGLAKVKDELASVDPIKTGVRKAMAQRRAVLMHGGIEIGTEDMAWLAGSAVSKELGNIVAPSNDMDEETLDKHVLDLSSHAGVQDLMQRYGEDVSSKAEQQNKEVRELAGLENLKRQLCVYTAQTQTIEEQQRVSALLEAIAAKQLGRERLEQIQEEADNDRDNGPMGGGNVVGKLRVTVVGAKGLPKMDIFKVCDSYCVMYVDTSQFDEVFQTAVVSGAEPDYNETFTWNLMKKTRFLTVSMMDKDQTTRDDIIGYVRLPLRDLQFGEQKEEWFKVSNPANESRVKDAHLKLKIVKVVSTTAQWKSTKGDEIERALGQGGMLSKHAADKLQKKRLSVEGGSPMHVGPGDAAPPPAESGGLPPLPGVAQALPPVPEPAATSPINGTPVNGDATGQSNGEAPTGGEAGAPDDGDAHASNGEVPSEPPPVYPILRDGSDLEVEQA